MCDVVAKTSRLPNLSRAFHVTMLRNLKFTNDLIGQAWDLELPWRPRTQT